MADKNKQAEEQPAAEEQEAPLVQSPPPDAKHYALQETSAVLLPHIGEAPADRFMEEALKGSEEDHGGGAPAHPEENQPPMGIAEGDELPDTTGRSAPGRLK